MRPDARSWLRSARLLPGVPGPDRVVASFDQVAGATVLAAAVDDRPALSRPSLTVQAQQPALRDPFARRPPHRTRVAALPGGRLVGGGCVVTGDGRLVGETVWDADHLHRELGRPGRLPVPARVAGSVFSLVSLWSENYYHWLVDALPRLATLRAALAEAPGKVVLPARTAAFHTESLRVAALGEAVGHTGGHLRADRLVWAAAPAPINYPTPYVVDWLRDLFGARHGGERTRLYVRRTGPRAVANEPAVLAALAPYGFLVVRPETMTVAEQARLFASAEVVVGPHGAGLANMAFARDATVVELFARSFVSPCYATLAAAAGHTHWYVVGEPVPGRGGRKSWRVRVPVDDLSATLRQVLG